MSGNYERMNELVHAGIRRDLTRLEQVIREPLSVQRRQALATRVGWLVGFLHHHHASEEEAIWPLAVRKQPQLVELVAAMEKEHHALATAADELRSAAATFAFDGSQSQRQALADALRRMQGACLPHLEHEETVAVPQLMETLDEREWALVDKRFRRGVSPKQLGWIAMWLLDDLAPDDLAFLRSQLPRPVFWFLSWRWGSAYDREASLAWGDHAGVRVQLGGVPADARTGPGARATAVLASRRVSRSSSGASPIHASAVLPLQPLDAWEFVFGDQSRRAAAASGMITAIEDYVMRPDGTPRYTMVMKMGPLTTRSTSDYSVFEPPRRTVNTVLGSPFGGQFFVQFDPVEGGTCISERWDTQPRSRVLAAVMPLLNPVMTSALQRDLDAWASAAARG